MNCNELFDFLKKDLEDTANQFDLLDKQVSVTCKTLTAFEAIGDTEHKDYPIIKGREVMLEADFQGSKGQAFTDEFENKQYSVADLLSLELNTNRERSSFIAAFNAIYRYLNKCEKTIHCKDKEPVECASQLKDFFPKGAKILLVGYQPRFLEYLAKDFEVRVVDMDEDNINQERFGVIVDPPEKTEEAIEWCDQIFVTGSTIANGTVVHFMDLDKPVTFYGTTIAAAAPILSLNTYCKCGH